MEQKSTTVKDKIAYVILGLIVAAVFFYAVFDIVNSFHPNGEVFSDSLKKGSYMEGTGYYATNSVLSVKHTANYIIPLGTEYYYLVFNEEFSDYVLVRAPKKWKYADKDDVSFDISGKIKTLDYDSANTLRDTLRKEGLSESAISTYYVDTMSQRSSVMVAILIVVAGLFGVVLLQINKGTIQIDEKKKSTLSTISGIIVFLACAGLIHYIIMML